MTLDYIFIAVICVSSIVAPIVATFFINRNTRKNSEEDLKRKSKMDEMIVEQVLKNREQLNHILVVQNEILALMKNKIGYIK